MATQIVMDHTGDTRHVFEPTYLKVVAKAEHRFRQLTSVGFTAAVRTGRATSQSRDRSILRQKETLFFPRLVGG